MNREQEQFKDVRRLLALKRHETPPPGYFNRFSGDVMARIKAGERAPDRVGIIDRITSLLGLQSAMRALETRPVVATGVGFAMCAALVLGLVMVGSGSDSSGQIAISGSNLDVFNNQMVVSPSADPNGTDHLALPNPGAVSIASSGDSLFERAASQQPAFLRASFAAPAGTQ